MNVMGFLKILTINKRSSGVLFINNFRILSNIRVLQQNGWGDKDNIRDFPREQRQEDGFTEGIERVMRMIFQVANEKQADSPEFFVINSGKKYELNSSYPLP